MDGKVESVTLSIDTQRAFEYIIMKTQVARGVIALALIAGLMILADNLFEVHGTIAIPTSEPSQQTTQQATNGTIMEQSDWQEVRGSRTSNSPSGPR